MDEMYVNVGHVRPDKSNISTNPTVSGPTSSESRHHGAVVLSLSLLSVFLLAGLIVLSVHYHGLAADFSSVKASLSEHLQISDNKSLSLTKERDWLNSTLTEVTKSGTGFRVCLNAVNKHVPQDGQCSMILLPPVHSVWFWGKARQDCRGSDHMWIGLTDKEEEGIGNGRWNITNSSWINGGNLCQIDHVKPEKSDISTNPTGPTSSESRCHGAVVLSLSLLRFSCWLDSSSSVFTIMAQLQSSLSRPLSEHFHKS
ncbi:hypothetical protein INR49_027019, partial [Caranx melampygus]